MRSSQNTTKQKFASVISELTEANRERDVLRSKLGAEKEAATRPLDPEDDTVIVCNNGVLSKRTTTTNCSFSAKIHEEPKPFLKAHLENYAKDDKLLFQEVVKDERSSEAEAEAVAIVIVYWSFMVDKTKSSCDPLLRWTVEMDGEEIRIGVTSVEELGTELGANLHPDPHPTATKKRRLHLSKGTILLQPLPLGQTSFTFSAQVKAKEEIARHRLIDHEAPVDDNDGDILGIARPLFLDDILE
ncbi:hypothetical protein TL16_g12910 [Triparma laevis f. inornata]|uniref:Uncharacterized protein n=1 Tax=Triparma laevis f. inornata TaxID=1714386 RepID=A0A9W7EYH9_9STRA|nr:hypothetical protein TL16_g12910 [Triparma laevis f. inornata]